MNAQTLARQVESLFSLPEIALRINEILNSSEPLNAELEEVITSDPAFTARILKIVNSSYFGFPGTIDTISRAITIIGLKELRNLVITSSLTSCFKGISEELVDMDVFWYHSVTSAVIARNLAKELKCSNYERLFIVGLLHSIGRLIYFAQCPELSRKILSYKDQGEDVMIAKELDVLGFTHAELSAEFLKGWGLPAEIWKTIESYLDPLNGGDFIRDACVLHIAGKIAGSIEPCATHDYDFNEIEPNIKPGVFDYLDVNASQVQSCIDDAVFQVFGLLAIIRPSAMTVF